MRRPCVPKRGAGGWGGRAVCRDFGLNNSSHYPQPVLSRPFPQSHHCQRVLGCPFLCLLHAGSFDVPLCLPGAQDGTPDMASHSSAGQPQSSVKAGFLAHRSVTPVLAWVLSCFAPLPLSTRRPQVGTLAGFLRQDILPLRAPVPHLNPSFPACEMVLITQPPDAWGCRRCCGVRHLPSQGRKGVRAGSSRGPQVNRPQIRTGDSQGCSVGMEKRRWASLCIAVATSPVFSLVPRGISWHPYELRPQDLSRTQPYLPPPLGPVG